MAKLVIEQRVFSQFPTSCAQSLQSIMGKFQLTTSQGNLGQSRMVRFAPKSGLPAIMLLSRPTHAITHPGCRETTSTFLSGLSGPLLA